MTIDLNRYYHTRCLVKSQLVINHVPFGEAREADSVPGMKGGLEAGTYRCQCVASELSPMTLKVCRQRGKGRIIFGWDLLRQSAMGIICMGAADTDVPPEERELVRQQETFKMFTQMIYKAYTEGEEFVLNINECFI